MNSDKRRLIAFVTLTFSLLLFVPVVQSQITVTLRPTADGSVEQWQNNAGASCASNVCFSQVNETSGSTNCAASSFVPGSGTVNKSPATTGQVQQYALTLTSIPDGSIITNITVYSCQARAGTQNTSGTLRIVLNAGLQECGASQAANAAFAEVSCSFTTNVTKGAGTTLEIGNKTTQNRNIQHDSIAATVTYTGGSQNGPAAASVHISPAVTKGFDSIRPPAAVHFDPPCCVLLTSVGKPAANVHITATATGEKPGTGVGRSPNAGFTTDTPCCVLMSTPFSQTISFSATATGVNSGTGQSRAATSAFHIAPACQACTGTSFLTPTINFATIAVAVPGIGRLAAGATHFSPVPTTKRNVNAAAAVSVHFAPNKTSIANLTLNIPVGFGIFTPIQVQGPTPSNKTADTALPSFHVETQVDVSAFVTYSVAQAFHTTASARPNVGLNKAAPQALHVVATAVAVTQAPKTKFVIVVTD